MISWMRTSTAAATISPNARLSAETLWRSAVARFEYSTFMQHGTNETQFRLPQRLPLQSDQPHRSPPALPEWHDIRRRSPTHSRSPAAWPRLLLVPAPAMSARDRG